MNEDDQAAAEHHQQELEYQEWIEAGCPWPIPKSVWDTVHRRREELKNAYQTTR
jgi:hypothetical protein